MPEQNNITNSLAHTKWNCKYHRSEEHTSELQSHSEISYAVFCLVVAAIFFHSVMVVAAPKVNRLISVSYTHLFPLRYPINPDTLIFGGILRSRWM